MARIHYRQLQWRQAPLRRFYYHATSGIVLAPLILFGLILAGALFYYYNRYSAIIDNGLRGDIFVRSSGIYAAPLGLREGLGVRLNELVAHLRKIGYQEGGAGDNEKRGYYSVRGAVVEIYPSREHKVDGNQAFPNLRVIYGRGGDSIVSITETDNQHRVPQALVEPELISSVVNQEREKRKIIEYKDLPQTLVDAIVAIEDRQFFEHSGINWRGVLRALFRDYQAGEIREGGSSITQQLVKNFFLTSDRSWKRKLSEAYMSVILEQRLSKEQIMEMYCNQIYLGQRGGFSINGFGEAARAYFGKDVSHLQLHESALLAGIIRSPNYYSPFSHEDRARERRNLVLEKMVEASKITEDQSVPSKQLPLEVVRGAGAVNASDAPYFIDYLTRQIESQYDDRGGNLRSLRIYSTIDMELQNAAYQAVAKNMVEVDRLMAQRRRSTAGLQCALVAMNARTGEILAMIGGRDYAQSQLNRATEARRQPGSVFKPFVYAAAIALGGDELNNPITTATTFVDEPKSFDYGGGIYEPGNYGDKFEMRPLTVRDALVLSKNVITVEVAQRIGLAQVVRMAERAGLTKVPPVPSVALGVAEATPLQMASAYTSFANQGRRVLPISIRRVTTKDGTSIYDSRTETRDVMSPQVAYIMTSIMQDVLDRGTGTRVRQMGFTGVAAGKTGSSRDAWFAGYTPRLVCAVWIGFDDNSDIGLTGGVVAAPIWADFMIRALRARPDLGGNFEDPGDLVVSDIDPATGEPVTSDVQTVRQEIFIRGTEPGASQPLPDNQVPGTEPLDIPGGEMMRPTPTPRPATDERMSADLGGIDPRMIPLPPEAITTRPRPGPSSTPRMEQTNTGRVKEVIGTSPPATARPTPTPTPRPRPDSKPSTTSSSRASPTPPAVSQQSKPKTPDHSKPAVRPRRVTGQKPEQAKETGKKKEVRKDDRKDAAKTARKPESKPTPAKKSGDQLAKASKPAPTPEPPPKPPPTPTPSAPPPAPKGDGTFTLEVCSTSGLLPARGLCKSTERRRYKLGSEPTRYCSARHHGGN
jgi:penicillin-binding protein 1B